MKNLIEFIWEKMDFYEEADKYETLESFSSNVQWNPNKITWNQSLTKKDKKRSQSLGSVLHLYYTQIRFIETI